MRIPVNVTTDSGNVTVLKKLFLPFADLVGMQLKLLAQFGHRLVLT